MILLWRIVGWHSNYYYVINAFHKCNFQSSAEVLKQCCTKNFKYASISSDYFGANSKWVKKITDLLLLKAKTISEYWCRCWDENPNMFCLWKEECLFEDFKDTPSYLNFWTKYFSVSLTYTTIKFILIYCLGLSNHCHWDHNKP